MTFNVRKSFFFAAGIAVSVFATGAVSAAPGIGTQALAGGTVAAAPRVGTQALAAGGTRAAVPGGTQAAAAPRVGTQALAAGGTRAAAPAAGTQALGTQAARPGQAMTLGTQALAAGGTRAAVPAGTQAAGTQAAGTRAAIMGTQALAAGGAQAAGTQAAGTRAAIVGTQALAGAGTRAAVQPGTRAAGTQAAGAPRVGMIPAVVPEIHGALHPVSTKNPGTLVILRDGSGSMYEEFAPGVQKAQAAATSINSTLADFSRSSNQGGQIRNRWNIAVVDYNGNGVKNGFSGGLGGHNGFVGIADVAQNPADVHHVPDAEGQLVPSPLWVHAAAEGGTPMKQAFEHVNQIISGHEKNLVLGVHVTDGASTDGDPSHAVGALAQKVHAAGGQLLMTNIHVTANADPARALVFPTEAEVAALNDPHATLLYSLSSPIPSHLAEQLGTAPGARMFAYNAAPDQLARVFRAGSSVAGGALAP